MNNTLDFVAIFGDTILFFYQVIARTVSTKVTVEVTMEVTIKIIYSIIIIIMRGVLQLYLCVYTV